jgi:hypothetical protein
MTWENLLIRVEGRIQPTAERYQAFSPKGLLRSIYRNQQVTMSWIKIHSHKHRISSSTPQSICIIFYLTLWLTLKGKLTSSLKLLSGTQ